MMKSLADIKLFHKLRAQSRRFPAKNKFLGLKPEDYTQGAAIFTTTRQDQHK